MKSLTSSGGVKRLPGDEGMWMFLLGDLLMFSLFFGLYMYYRSVDLELYSSSQALLNNNYGFANTLILLLSSLFVVLGIKAAGAGNKILALRFLRFTILCAVIFMTLKGFEYYAKISNDITIISNDFFMYYYMLTGLHLIHVVVGTALIGFFIFSYSKNDIDDKALESLETRATFWHMVDLLWIVIFPLLYLI